MDYIVNKYGQTCDYGITSGDRFLSVINEYIPLDTKHTSTHVCCFSCGHTWWSKGRAFYCSRCGRLQRRNYYHQKTYRPLRKEDGRKGTLYHFQTTHRAERICETCGERMNGNDDRYCGYDGIPLSSSPTPVSLYVFFEHTWGYDAIHDVVKIKDQWFSSIIFCDQPTEIPFNERVNVRSDNYEETFEWKGLCFRVSFINEDEPYYKIYYPTRKEE